MATRQTANTYSTRLARIGPGEREERARDVFEGFTFRRTSSVVALGLPHRRPSRVPLLLASRSLNLGARGTTAMCRWT